MQLAVYFYVYIYTWRYIRKDSYRSSSPPPPPFIRRKNGGGPLAKAANFKRDSFRMHPQVTENPPRPNSEGNAAAASASAGGSSPSLVRRESASRSEDSGNTAAAKAADGGGGIGAGGSHGGDEAAGGGGSTGGGRAPASSTRPLSGAGQRDFVKRGRGAGNGVDGGAVAAAASEGSGDGGDKIHVPRNVSMEESGGTNPLYKNGAPPDTSGSGLDSQSVSGAGLCRSVFGVLCFSVGGRKRAPFCSASPSVSANILFFWGFWRGGDGEVGGGLALGTAAYAPDTTQQYWCYFTLAVFGGRPALKSMAMLPRK